MVCRLWQASLTPLLWLVYDEEQMSIGWRIPTDVLRAHNSHFRFALLSQFQPTFTLQATCLRELCLQSEALSSQANIDLIGSNPRLTRLEVSFQYEEYGRLRSVLESLSQLQYIKFGEPSLDKHDSLSSFFNNNPGLQDIRLSDPAYISGFKGCQPLVNLTRLELDNVDWGRNPGLLELFSLIPNLTALNFVHRGDLFPIVTELCATLRENCPKLDWIRYRNANSRIGCALQAEHIVPWIQASPRLVHFDTLASTFTTSIYWSLMYHASWIDTLCLKFLKGIEENARNTSKILGHCTHLRSLKVIHASTISKLSLEWFEEPWRTDNIESLCLQGFTDPLKRVKGLREPDNLDRLIERLSRPRTEAEEKIFKDLSQGWTPVTYDHERSRITATAWAFRDLVFRRMRNAPRLYRLTVECFGYVNNSQAPVGCLFAGLEPL
ncbi:hypothetical protein CPB97_003348 [Podila verticillata]|nr:hypothetical protein CPB97_003348 [Podila verticillata]